MKRPKNGFFFPLCYVAYMSIYIARLNLSTASPGLIQLGILDSAQIGLLGSTFSVVYASGRLINGILSDSRPPWVMISSGLISECCCSGTPTPSPSPCCGALY